MKIIFRFIFSLEFNRKFIFWVRAKRCHPKSPFFFSLSKVSVRHKINSNEKVVRIKQKTCSWCENRTTSCNYLNWKLNHLAPLTLVTTSFTKKKKKIRCKDSNPHRMCYFHGRFSEHRIRMQCHLGSAERPTAALSNPHLSSKAAKRRASRMFSSGSQVLYLYHKNEGGGGVSLLT